MESNYPNGNNYENNEDKSNTFTKDLMHFRATRLGTTFFFVSLISLLFRTIIFPFLFAPLSIFFAYLAKGKRRKNDWYNNLTIFFSVIILVINLVFCGYCVYSVSHNTRMHQKYDEVSRQVYGVSFDEYMKQMRDALENPGELQNSIPVTPELQNSIQNPGGVTNE